MKILSLFDGMACGMIAMLNAGIEVESYDAYEFDVESANEAKGRKFGYAALVASHNFPNIQQHGDVFKADFTQHEGVDYLVGGSPCTYWSIAQKNNRETEASGMGWELFSQYVRAVREAKPKFFIYENNKSMSAAIRASIDKTFGFEAVCINSALVSAQNRQRLYWVGKRNADGTYSRVSVDQPEDRGILLRDVLDTGEPINTTAEGDKARTLMAGYYKYGTATLITNEGFTGGTTAVAEPINTTADGKAQCLRATYYKDGIRNMVGNDVDRRTCVAEPVPIGTSKHHKANRIGGFYGQVTRWGVYGTDGKSPTLTAAMGMGGGHIPMVTEPVRVGEVGNGGQGNRIYSVEGKSVAQTATSEGIGSNTGLYAIPIEFEDSEPVKAISYADGKIYPVHRVENGQITVKGKQYPIKLTDGLYIIRKLTLSECMRLQTVPEWYDFSVISLSQAYKCLGNGWTCDVITHLINATQAAARKRWLDDLLGGCL